MGNDGRSARRLDTQAAVLDAAGELFAAKGVSSTSMDDIAVRAGIAKGSLYYNFESKSGLVSALLARSVERLRTALDAAVEGRQGAELRRVVVSTLLSEMAAHPHVAKLLATELFRTDRDWRDGMQQWREATMRHIEEDLRVTDAGLSAAEASLRAAAVIGATLMTGMEWLLYRPESSYDEVVAAALQRGDA